MRKAEGYIIGVVGHDDSVDSVACDTCRGHRELFPGHYGLRWRWCAEWGLRETDHARITGVLADEIREHVRRKHKMKI